jgi:hypothetical protein
VMELAPLEEKTTPVFVSLPRAVFQESFNLIITIESESGGRQIVRTVSFLGPQT